MENTTLSPTSTFDITHIAVSAWYEIPICALIALLGTLFNTLSLVYFIKYESEQLGSKLLMLLNVFDLCVCTSSALIVFMEILRSSTSSDHTLDVVMAVYVVASESTSFSTCLLSVVRCWCLCFPFNKVNNCHLVLSTACFLAYILGREIAYTAIRWNGVHRDLFITFGLVREYLTIVSICSIIIIVIVSNMISIKKVIAARGSKDLIEVTKRAAVTVFLVSSIFCLYNSSFIVLFCIFLNIPRSSDLGMYFLEFLTFRVFLPMNSATNPLIYLLRKVEMRQFVLSWLYRIKMTILRLFGRQTPNGTGQNGEELASLTENGRTEASIGYANEKKYLKQNSN